MPSLSDSVEPDESVRVSWEGSLREDARQEQVALGTTDRCLVFRSESGRIGTIPREHVSSVESRVETRVDYVGNDYRLMVGGGGGAAALALLAALASGSGLLALVLTALAVGSLWLAEHGWRNREQFDGIDRVESTVELVTVRTSDGTRREFVIPVENRAGARINEFVRDGQPAVPAGTQFDATPLAGDTGIADGSGHD